MKAQLVERQEVVERLASTPTVPVFTSILEGLAWRDLAQRDASLAAVVLRFIELGDESSAVKLLLRAFSRFSHNHLP